MWTGSAQLRLQAKLPLQINIIFMSMSKIIRYTKTQVLLFFMPALLCITSSLRAQLIIQKGITLSCTGNSLVTLQDIDLVVSGGLTQYPGTAHFLFTGNGNTSTGRAHSNSKQSPNLSSPRNPSKSVLDSKKPLPDSFGCLPTSHPVARERIVDLSIPQVTHYLQNNNPAFSTQIQGGYGFR